MLRLLDLVDQGDGVVLRARTVHAQVPPRVDYELTDLGGSLTGPIATLTDWAETHLGRILAAREHYDGLDDR